MNLNLAQVDPTCQYIDLSILNVLLRTCISKKQLLLEQEFQQPFIKEIQTHTTYKSDITNEVNRMTIKFFDIKKLSDYGITSEEIEEMFLDFCRADTAVGIGGDTR